MDVDVGNTEEFLADEESFLKFVPHSTSESMSHCGHAYRILFTLDNHIRFNK